MLERQTHPYKHYLPETAEAVIIGSAPPWRCCTGKAKDLRVCDIDFFYGSMDNRFWCVMFEVMGTKPEPVTVEQLKKILKDHKLGMGDILKSFTRKGRKATDTALSKLGYNVNLVEDIINRGIRKLFFTSVFSYNKFKVALRKQGCAFEEIENENRQYSLLVSRQGFEQEEFEIRVLLSPSRTARNSFEDLVANYKEQFSQFF